MVTRGPAETSATTKEGNRRSVDIEHAPCYENSRDLHKLLQEGFLKQLMWGRILLPSVQLKATRVKGTKV